MTEEKELKGIFAWEQDSSKLRVMGTTGKLLTTYLFPQKVVGYEITEDSGAAYFFSKESREFLIEQSMKDIINSGVFDKRNLTDCMTPKYIFLSDKERKSFREKPFIWLKTNFEGREVILYDDLFRDNQVAKCSNGETFDICIIPFSEESPISHMTDDGNYDTADIYKWPIYQLDLDEDD